MRKRSARFSCGTTAFLAFFLTLCCGAFAQSQSVPSRTFSLGTLTIQAPQDSDWKIVRQSPDGVVLSGNTESVTRLAYAQLFAFPPPHDRASFLAEVKRNVERSLSIPGITLGTSSYEYNDARGFPCVTVGTFTDVQHQPGWPRGHVERLQYRMMFCKVPQMSDRGIVVSFSYSGATPSLELDGQAAEFIGALASHKK